MSTRKVVGHLRELYGIDVSPDLISALTDAVLEEVTAWQARPLEAIYALIFFDALRVKIREEGLVPNRAVHIALGVRADGTKQIPGLWLEQNESAKFWLRVKFKRAGRQLKFLRTRLQRPPLNRNGLLHESEQEHSRWLSRIFAPSPIPFNQAPSSPFAGGQPSHQYASATAIVGPANI
jgi:hypothetical protein